MSTDNDTSAPTCATLDEDTLDSLTIVTRGHWHAGDWQGTAAIAIRTSDVPHHGRELSAMEFGQSVATLIANAGEPVRYAPEKVRNTLVGIAVRAHGSWWSCPALAFLAPSMVRIHRGPKAMVVLDDHGNARALVMSTDMTDAEVAADRYEVNREPRDGEASS